MAITSHIRVTFIQPKAFKTSFRKGLQLIARSTVISRAVCGQLAMKGYDYWECPCIVRRNPLIIWYGPSKMYLDTFALQRRFRDFSEFGYHLVTLQLSAKHHRNIMTFIKLDIYRCAIRSPYSTDGMWTGAIEQSVWVTSRTVTTQYTLRPSANQ